MKPLLVTALPVGPEWSYEVKWDGFRVLLVKSGEGVELISRNNKSLTKDFPGVTEAGSRIGAKTAVIDGEIVAIDERGHPSFQLLQNRSSNDATIVFYAFDLLHLDGAAWTGKTLVQRRAKLAKVIGRSGLVLSRELPGNAEEVTAAVAQLGLEGVVAKRRTSPYQPGERNYDWQKMRINAGQEFVVGGYKPGGRFFESLLVGYYDDRKLIFAGKVRAGFTPRTREQVWKLIANDGSPTCPFSNLPDRREKGRWGEGITPEDMAELRWVRPKRVVRVGFVEWTRHGNLRHATFQGIRTDKRPNEIRRELANVPA
jgi:bifunctional non-homologous end joining protein LigD